MNDAAGPVAPPTPAAPPRLEFKASRDFPRWLAEQRIALALTTYQTGKLFLIGLKPDASLSIVERGFQRCMGLWSDSQTMWMASLCQLWRFENMLEPGQATEQGFDRLYVPQVGYTTGGVDAHDIAADAHGRPVFVNTRFSCLATVSETHSFTPLWRPPFISELTGEDRCHLNGLAMEDGRPRYVTACAATDTAEGWRDHRTDGGRILSVENNEVVAAGLSMPHSPRVHQNKLWLLNSGTGYFGYIDRSSGAFQPVTFCPGYARGLTFTGGFAVVGLSEGREQRSFGGLPLEKNLQAARTEGRCGLLVVDLRSGEAAHWLRIEGPVKELYDVVVLRDVHRPMALGFKTEEIRRTVTLGEQNPL